MTDKPKVAKVIIKTKPIITDISIVYFELSASSPVRITPHNQFILFFTNGETYPPNNQSYQGQLIVGGHEFEGDEDCFVFEAIYDELFQGSTNWKIEKIEFRPTPMSPGFGWTPLQGQPEFEFINENHPTWPPQRPTVTQQENQG
ncbi:MAG: hypothetical protein KDC44_16530 [Phaeodactylibacter sp.]|nr:hypothetical protein [Phaeodactylibacter sp.]